MRIILSIIAIILVSCNSNVSRRTTEIEEIIRQLSQNDTVRLQPKVYDFTGYKDIPVKGYFDLNGATIKADSMLQIGFNDNHLLFNLLPGASIVNGTIRGASGRSESLLIGYFGAVKTLGSARIENMKFINCDKWAICSTGDRFSFTDTVFITNCVFDSIARTGSGYAEFNPYSTVIMTGCTITNVRHAFDMGGSPNPIGVIRNNIFRRCYFIPINQHKIDGQGTCGAGLTIVGNYFYHDYIPMQLVSPSSGTLRIDSNYFSGGSIGTVNNVVIPKGSNYLNGEGMPPKPRISFTKRLFQTGEQITLKASGGSVYNWSNGSKSDKITTRGSLPMVRVYSCYSRGLEDTVTILVHGGQSPYMGIRAMSGGGNIEFWRNEKLLKKVPANKFYNYQYFMQYHDSVSIRVRGLVYFDDYVRSGGFYDTFEEGVRVKVTYKGRASVSRKLFNVSSGFRNLTVEVDSGYVELR
jgi:hypothetical protein